MSIEQQPIGESRVRLFAMARSGETFVTQNVKGEYTLHYPPSIEQPVDDMRAEMAVVKGDLERIGKDFENFEELHEYRNTEAEKWHNGLDVKFSEMPLTRRHIEAMLVAMHEREFQEKFGEKVKTLAEKLLKENVVIDNEDLRKELNTFIS